MGLFNLLGLGTSPLFNSMHYTNCNSWSCPISSCLCDYKARCFLIGRPFFSHTWVSYWWIMELLGSGYSIADWKICTIPAQDLLWPKFFMLKSSLPLSFKHHSTTGLQDSGLQYYTRIYIMHCGVCLALICFVGHTVQYFVNCSCSSKSLSDWGKSAWPSRQFCWEFDSFGAYFVLGIWQTCTYDTEVICGSGSWSAHYMHNL